MNWFWPASMLGMVSIPGIPLRSEISPYGVCRQPERGHEVRAEVARGAIVVPPHKPEPHVEHCRRVEGMRVGHHHLRRNEMLGEYGSPYGLAVAVHVDRQVRRLPPGVAAEDALVLTQVVVGAKLY